MYIHVMQLTLMKHICTNTLFVEMYIMILLGSAVTVAAAAPKQR